LRTEEIGNDTDSSLNVHRVTTTTPVEVPESDDYPTWLRNAPKDSLVDPWGFYSRECTSFVAYRLNRDGHDFRNVMRGQRFGNAAHWDDAAAALGWRVDHSGS